MAAGSVGFVEEFERRCYGQAVVVSVPEHVLFLSLLDDCTFALSAVCCLFASHR